MSNGPLVKCAACGESNEATMRFCISCGSDLKNKKVSEQVWTAKEGVVCQTCGKTDSLNNQFCISCGSKTIAKDVEQKTRNKPIAALVVLFGIVLGIAGGMAFVKAGYLNGVAGKNWPTSGLVVYAGPTQSNLLIADLKDTIFILGITGPTGAIAIPNIEPGKYMVMLSNTTSNVQHVTYPAEINLGKSCVLGFPKAIQLTTKLN